MRDRRRARLASVQHHRRAGHLPPVVALRAKGAWLTSRATAARWALDAMASWWTAVHGHGPVLDAALTDQLA